MTPLDRLIKAATAVVDSITYDDVGVFNPRGVTGGNGGMISQQTIAATDELRRAIAAAEKDLATQEMPLQK